MHNVTSVFPLHQLAKALLKSSMIDVMKMGKCHDPDFRSSYLVIGIIFFQEV